MIYEDDLIMDDSDKFRMHGTGRTIPRIRLSALQIEEFKQMADESLKHMLHTDDLTSHNYDWEQCKRRENVFAYVGSRERRNLNCRFYRSTGSMKGSVQEMVEGNMGDTKEDFLFLSKALTNDFYDGDILYEIEDMEHDDTVRKITIKWQCFRPWLNASYDLLYLEFVGKTTDRRGDTVGFSIIQSIQLEDFPPFSRYFRANVVERAYLFRDSPDKGKVELTRIAYLINSGAPNWMFDKVALDRCFDIIRLMKHIDAARYSSVVFVEQDHWVPNELRHLCGFCDRKFHRFRGKHHCRRCGEVFCSRCLTKKLVVFNDNVSKLKLCSPCIISARNSMKVPTDSDMSSDDSDHEMRPKTTSANHVIRNTETGLEVSPEEIQSIISQLNQLGISRADVYYPQNPVQSNVYSNSEDSSVQRSGTFSSSNLSSNQGVVGLTDVPCANALSDILERFYSSSRHSERTPSDHSANSSFVSSTASASTLSGSTLSGSTPQGVDQHEEKCRQYVQGPEFELPRDSTPTAAKRAGSILDGDFNSSGIIVEDNPIDRESCGDDTESESESWADTESLRSIKLAQLRKKLEENENEIRRRAACRAEKSGKSPFAMSSNQSEECYSSAELLLCHTAQQTGSRIERESMIEMELESYSDEPQNLSPNAMKEVLFLTKKDHDSKDDSSFRTRFNHVQNSIAEQDMLLKVIVDQIASNPKSTRKLRQKIQAP